MSETHLTRFPIERGVRAWLHYGVLTVGLLAMTANTIDGWTAQTKGAIATALFSCLGFFAVEFCLNIVHARQTGGHYPFSAQGAIDLLALVPIPIALLSGIPSETAWLFAALWLLKLSASVPGLSLLGRVVVLEARPLASVLVLFLIFLLLAGIALHLLERGGQPEHFGSLPAALWWAVATLTTTGYGDAVPQTFAGRLIAGTVMICGLGVFGLWTGILATGFAAEHRRRDFIRNWDLVTKVPFFRSLDPAAVIEITRMLRRLDIPERTVVVRQGRPGDCMYFIASGEVEVRIEPKPIRLGAGAFFGEIALLAGGLRTATVATTSPSTLLILEVSDFRTFTAHHPELAKAVEAEAQRRSAEITAASKTLLQG